MVSEAPENAPARVQQAAEMATDFACPVCLRAGFEPTDRTIDLDLIMKRWSEVGVQLRPDTMRAFSRAVHGELRLHACAKCGFARFQPVVVGDADFYAAITEDDYYNNEKWEFDRASAIVSAANASSVLDVGCGAGHFLEQVRRSANGAVSLGGVELSEVAAERARAIGFDVFVSRYAEGDFVDLPKADVVCAFQVLEHVADPIGFLAGLKQITRPEGLVLIGVPDAEGLISRHWDSLTELPPHHVSYWTGESLAQAFAAVGLELVSLEREPLSKVLWEGYFPDIWSDGAWPSRIGRAVARLAREPGDGMLWVSRTLASARMTALYGVGGHSMLAVGRSIRKRGAGADGVAQ